jgi:hypothetical protein
MSWVLKLKFHLKISSLLVLVVNWFDTAVTFPFTKANNSIIKVDPGFKFFIVKLLTAGFKLNLYEVFVSIIEYSRIRLSCTVVFVQSNSIVFFDWFFESK